MLGMEARRRNRQRDLRQFLQLFCPRLDKTRVKFFRQALRGVLLSHSLIVARWLRWIGPDRCRQRFYRQKRLLNQLKSQHWDHQQVLRQYQQQWSARIDPDTPLIVDLSDLAKPRARKLKHLALVRDGSNDGRLVTGYWCLEVYAYLGQRRIVPLLLHPYSIEDPQVLGENAVILRGVEQVMAATGGKGVLVMDRGADRSALLLPWIDHQRRFIVRLRGDRHLLLDDGTHIEALLLAERLLQLNRSTRAWRRVYLPQRPDRALYLVAKTLPGHDRPLILLTTQTAQDANTAATILKYYRWRWRCEESARFLKTDLGLERFCVRTYHALPRLLLLATLAMALLTWLQLRYPSLREHLREQRPGRRRAKFLYYRLSAWLAEQFLPRLSSAAPP